MANRLNSGDKFPTLTLKLTRGGEFHIPGGIHSKYLIAVFYRGHWCPYCRRQLAAVEKQRAALEALGAQIVAGSADEESGALEVAKELSFSIAFGMTGADAERLGAWWGEQRGNLQPAEFLIDKDGEVIQSLYASGPIGRMSPEDLVRLLTRRAETEKKK
jgi:peroxiredoxin